MKLLVLVLWLLVSIALWTRPVLAGDLALTPVDNADGTMSIDYTYTGDPPVALALIVDVSGEQVLIESVAGDVFFDVYIDWYNSNPGALNDNDFADDGANPAADPAAAGVAILPASVISLSMAELDEHNDAPASGTLATIDFGSFFCGGVITGDTLRGCVVDVLGNEMTINGAPCATASVPFTSFCGECACRGDVTDGLGVPPGDGSVVDFGDLNYLIGQIAPTFSTPTTPDLSCADVADAIAVPVGGGDGTVDFGDLNYIITQLAPTFSTTCLP